jgi:hypothetical protein
MPLLVEEVMLKFTLLAAAAAITLAGAPAFATDPAAATVVAADGAKVSDVAATPAPKAETKYCVYGATLGSLIRQKECHTRKEWIETTGQDPLAKN